MTTTRTRRTVRAAAPAALTVALLAGCAGAPSAAPAQAAPAVRAVTAAPATSPVAVSRAVPAKATNVYAGKVRAYGDSVMLGAASALRSRLHAKVFAHESRQSWDVLSLVRKDRAKGRIHGPVVIHTGTNGTISQSDLTRTVKKLQRKHLVVLVNIELPSRYTWDDSNNKILAAVDREFANVVLLNWQKKASRHPGWLYSDGTHLTPSGSKAYARLVAKKLGR